MIGERVGSERERPAAALGNRVGDCQPKIKAKHRVLVERKTMKVVKIYE